MRTSARVVTLLVGFFVALGTPVVAQTATTSLRGTVYDAKGAVISGSSLTLTNPATGFSERRRATLKAIINFSNSRRRPIPWLSMPLASLD